MAEVLFYHLTERTLEQVLPGLLEKCLERNWRTVVQFGTEERMAVLDNHLWAYREESFLAHSALRDGTEQHQPIWLTTDTENPNQAIVRFMVDAAVPPDLSTYERGVYLFDGHDNTALDSARERWKIEKDAGHDVTYWQQNSSGRWEKKA
ncbi:MAG: DNA polymerase III subunit chi [Pseudomonadota bacterium]